VRSKFIGGGCYSPPMDRNTLLWTLVLFFGASLLFGALRRATEDSSTGVTLAVQLGALAIVIAAIVVVVRRLRR
jgi:uncharacterized membrane protein YhaH (DUF805 family)